MVQVIDTSVAIKWFVKESGHESSLLVLERLLANPGIFAVPELFYFELIHVFNRLIPQPRKNHRDILHKVLNIPLTRFAMSVELANEVENFQKLGLSGYDASYVGFAKMLKGTWLTFDQKAHSKIEHLGLSHVLE